ncbi:MAG: UPF0280 family protein [Firmicutes bacterium]|nr:UPF0280 family protein [Bacillota bacterium]
MDYRERFYREQYRQEDLLYFQVVVRETDLSIGVRRERFSPELARWVEGLVREQRSLLEEYIERDRIFLHTLEPHAVLPGAPPIAAGMARAASAAGVGPMAAVAGAFAQHVGRALAARSKDVIVENGGDIYLKSTRKRRIGIFAGRSPLSNRLALEVRPEDTPLGICTSSGTVGPSLSLGRADAAVILSPSAVLADAVATAAANLVRDPGDVERAAAFALKIEGITGAVIIKDDRLAACGNLKLLPLT